MGLKIKRVHAEFDESCTNTTNLISAGVTMPAIREVMEYTEPRNLFTLMTSGAKDPWDTYSNNTKTKIGVIPKGQQIGSSGMRYRKMGRIVKNSEIIAQVGTSTPGGYFQLKMRDNYLVPGMNVLFHDRTLQARVQGKPSGTPGNYIYSFQTITGVEFNWATHVAGQAGKKTCFGMFTTYGEKSLRGYSRTHYPDEYINHVTIQRQGFSMSGDALTEVIWVYFNGAKGWWFEKWRQARLQFMMQNEWHKIYGQSSMKAADGTVLERSRIQDEETGEDVIQGDGLLEQLLGGNLMYGSGAHGYADMDDFRDMMIRLRKFSTKHTGNHWYGLCADEGYSKAREVLERYWIDTMRGVINAQAKDREIEVGVNFEKIFFEGNTLTFVNHPMMADELAMTQRGADGTLLAAGDFIFVESTSEKGQNFEILTKGKNGIDRSLIMKEFDGMYSAGVVNPVTSEDSKSFECLKQDGLFIWNTMCCGVIRRG